MTLRHLASMTSGYARPEEPGKAWAYNDYAIQLYQKTLFDKVFLEPPDVAFHQPQRFGAGVAGWLRVSQIESADAARRCAISRVAWFWLNRGNWNGGQILPRAYFDDNMRPQVPRDLPVTPRPRRMIISRSAPMVASRATSPSRGRAPTDSIGGSTTRAACIPMR